MRSVHALKTGAIGFLVLMVLALWEAPAATAPKRPIDRVQHVIVIFMENWSFNGQFGRFPGANGIANAPPETIQQVKKDGTPYATLPQPLFNGQPDTRIPADLPVKPFDLAPYVPPGQLTNSPVHLFYQEKYQINGGRTRTVSVREMCRVAFACAGLDYQDFVRVDERFMRPAEVDVLLGNPAKAKARLGWEPTITFEQMIAEMVEADIARHRARMR